MCQQGGSWNLSKGKILLIAQNFYPEIGSAGNRMKNIYQMLRKQGFEVTILTNEPSYPNKKMYEDEKFWDDPQLNEDAHIHRVNVRNRKYSSSMANRLLYYLEMTLKMILFVLGDRNKYSNVFVTSPPIFIGLVGIIAKLRYKAKLLLDIRDLWPESLKGVGVFNNRFIIWTAARFETFLYKTADTIIVNSPGFIEYISKKAKIDAETIKYMPNSAASHELNLEEEKGSDEFKVIYTGNLGLAQDVDFLTELCQRMHEHRIKLNIVGYGYRKKELVQFIKKQKLNNITFVTPTTRAECLRLNKEHDVGIVSLNDKEVFDTVLPGKIVDYMITGLPIVAAVSGYAKKMIEKHETGYVSEKRDIDEIIEYILFLKTHADIRKKLSLNCTNLIKAQFLWEENIHVLISSMETQPDEVPLVSYTKTKVEKV